MSEANSPFNPQGQSQSASADSDWQEEPADLKGDGPNSESLLNDQLGNRRVGQNQVESQMNLEANLEANLETDLETALESSFDISQIFDASELEDLTLEAPQATNRSSIETWLQDHLNELQPEVEQLEVEQPEPPQADPQPELAHHSEPTHELPNLADLVSLIQELNQCNGLLMDRVSQLEEDLERSQTALQDEVGRTQQGNDSDQDWATVQEQVTNLFNQLEFAHQTNQRQQILIETLTGQLENSQERVAELEREAALIQQRYNEQTQLLAKSEHTSRDLQSRLQRQQRYTLQFKAALEKSLEVPTPQYEMGLNLEPTVAETVLTPEVLFLPKAKRIQPWSAQSHASKAQPLSKSPWMKFQNQLISFGSPLDRPDATPDAASDLAARSTSAPESSSSPAEQPATHLNLPSFGLPLLQFPSDQSSERRSELSESANVMPLDPNSGAADAALKQQLDEVVKPLADLLAEALLGETHAQAQSQAKPEMPMQRASDWLTPATSPQTEPESINQPDRSPILSSSLSSSFAAADENHPDETTADQLLASVMADAEDALWQDLARLIDVSAEDVVKASLSGDLAAFETLDFTALQSPNEPQTAPQAMPPSPKPSPQNQVAAALAAPPVPTVAANAVTVAPLLRRLNQPQVQPQAVTHLEEAESEPSELDSSESSGLTTSSWPSPVVYPLRPVKKRHSLAMVDLPSFPKG